MQLQIFSFLCLGHDIKLTFHLIVHFFLARKFVHKASAAIPRIYRIKFHRDIHKDLDAHGKAVGNGDEATDRPMTTPLFLLRCIQLGISIQDLDLLTIEMVNDMYAESSNDEYKGYARIATQRYFDAF